MEDSDSQYQFAGLEEKDDAFIGHRNQNLLVGAPPGNLKTVIKSVIVSKDKQALKQLKWVHVIIANMKGNIRGVYLGFSSKHLCRYLAEFLYRFNRREWYT